MCHVLNSASRQGYAILDISRNEATTTWYYAPELTIPGQYGTPPPPPLLRPPIYASPRSRMPAL